MPRPALIPTAYSTIGDLLAEVLVDGGKFSVSCSACKDWRVLTPVQIATLIKKHGPLWSPWNRHPPCPTCGRGRTFHAGGSPMRPLITPSLEDTFHLHRAWKRERDRRRGQHWL